MSYTYEDLYYQFRNAYLYSYSDILSYLDSYPVIRFDFVHWLATLINVHKKEPSYHTIVNRLEELSYKHRIMSNFSTSFADRYNKRKRDAEDMAATLAVESALKRRATVPRPIRITVPRRPAAYNRSVADSKEIKGVDINLGLTSVPYTYGSNAGFILLNGIQNGSGSYNRIGKNAFMKSIRIKLVAVHKIFNEAITANNYGANMRCILLWDRQPNASSSVTFNTVFGNTIQTGAESTVFADAIRYDCMSRFKILKEWMMTANRSASASPIALPKLPKPFETESVIKESIS